MAITAETRNDIIELVVTAYNAAPGTTLLTELVAIVDGGGSLADVATALTTSDRWAELYPSFQTAEEFAAEWLGALVPEADEDALAEGVSVAVGLLNGGASFADLILEAQGFLSTVEETDAAFGTSAANFNNKVEVATNHTVTLELDGTEDQLANVLADVTSDDDSVTEAIDGQSAEATGETFVLTDELDEVIGTTGNDEVRGVIGAAADTTFNVADDIDLGAGSNDVVSVTIVGAHSLAGHGAAGAERLNIKFTDDTAASTTASATVGSFPDATQIWVQDSTNVDSDNDDQINVTGVDEDSTIGVANNTSSTDVSFTTDGDDTSGDSITLAVGGGSTDDVTINDAAGDGIATVNIAVMGTASSTIGSLNAGTDFDEIVITGDQNLSLVGSVDAVPSSVETIDASAFTGNLTVNATASEDLAATGGSGSDTIALLVNDNIEEDMAIDGFETVSFYATGAGAEIDMDLITGASIFSINGISTALTLTLNDVAADQTFFATGLGSSTSGDTTSGITINLADDDGDSDSVSFAFNNLGVDAGSNDQGVGAMTVNGIETLNITADNYDDLDLASITGNDLVTINYSGDSDLDMGGAITAADLESFDGADATGDIEFTGAWTNTAVDSEFDTGAGDDVITNTALTAAHTQAIDTNAGDDTFTFTDAAAAFTGEITVDLGDGDDEATIGVAAANADVAEFELDGGDGADTLTVSTTDADISIGGFEDIILTATPGGTGLHFIDGEVGETTITDIAGAGVIITAVGGDLDASDLDYIGVGVPTLNAAAGVAADIVGSAENDTINGSTLNDDISTGAGTDTVDAGTGADDVTAGTGVDTLTQAAADSVAPSASVFANATAAAAGDTITFANGVDTVSSFTAGAGGDVLDMTFTGATLATLIAEDTTALTATSILFASGTWSSSTNTFTIAADGTGADTLLIDTTDTTITGNDNMIVLIGVDSDDLVAANIT